MIETADPTKQKNIFIIAGEPSGDALGAKLIHAMKAHAAGDHILCFSGVGGERMIEEGVRSLFDMSELSVMGFVEVLPHIKRIKQRIEDLAEMIADARPDVLITIDSPGFSIRLVKKIREKYACDIPIVHYVAPSVWAYKPKRAQKFARYYDQLMVILPFEPPYFEKEGLKTTFIGHPIIEEPIHYGSGRKFRLLRNIAPSSPIVTVLPGSREGEIARHLPIYEETFKQLSQHMRDMTVVMPTLPHLKHKLEKAVENWPVRVIVTADKDEKFAAYAASQAALAKSGTGALELSLARVPMIVTYRTNSFSAWLVRRMIKVKFVNLVNIILNKAVIPELIQDQCKPKKLAKALEQLLLERQEAEAQILESQKALRELGKGKTPLPSEKAAEVIFSIIN